MCIVNLLDIKIILLYYNAGLLMGKVILVLLLMHLSLLERKSLLLTGRKIIYKIVLYASSHNSCMYMHSNQQFRKLLVLKVTQGAFAMACCLTLLDMHKYWGGFKMAPSV